MKCPFCKKEPFRIVQRVYQVCEIVEDEDGKFHGGDVVDECKDADFELEFVCDGDCRSTFTHAKVLKVVRRGIL